MSELPAGFVLDNQPSQSAAPVLPQGFVLDQKPKGNKTWTDSAIDFARSIPTGLLAGISGLPNSNPALSQDEVNADLSARSNARDIAQKQGITHTPQGGAGKFGSAIGEALGNPLSYVGPGSLALKVGAGVISAVGSEGAGQLSEGTKYEAPARIAGVLAGGIAGAKAFGPTVERAAIPTIGELKGAANTGYDAARNSGLELKPSGLAEFAAQAQQDLTGPRYGFTGGPKGVAPKTLGILDDLQSAPSGATVTASNLDALRKNLGHIAGETQFTAAGPKPTADAKAASVLAEKLKGYMENIPQDHIMAGDPANYTAAIKQANGNWAAAARADAIGAKLTKAENQASRARGVGFDDTIRTKLATILDNPKQQRGFTADELAAIQKIHDGTLPINAAKEFGKFGVKGALSLALHTGAALGTGGATIPLAVAGTLSRKLADTLSRGKASHLDEMLRMRSPEYARRAAAVPAFDNSPNIVTLARSLLNVR